MSAFMFKEFSKRPAHQPYRLHGAIRLKLLGSATNEQLRRSNLAFARSHDFDDGLV